MQTLKYGEFNMLSFDNWTNSPSVLGSYSSKSPMDPQFNIIFKSKLLRG